MPDYGTVIFHNARASGVIVSQLGSGVFDHIGFFGPFDTVSYVQKDNFQDTTWIIDSAGNPMPGAHSGKMTNCKYIDSDIVKVSGFPNAYINQVNVFNPAALTTYPDFPHQTSGTLLIEYVASGVSEVHTYNAKIYAYDATGAITDLPPDVTVMGFEINASGQWYTGQSGVWVAMNAQGSPLYFVDHRASNGWDAEHKHIWVAAISVKPDAVGILNDFNLAFQFQYA